VPINTHKLQTGSNVTQITFANNSLLAEGAEFVTWQEDKKGSQQGPHVQYEYVVLRKWRMQVKEMKHVER